jgi:ketosteroid isomerase-like protein
MAAQLQPDAFFKSPDQFRYGRDMMAKTVLTANPPVIKDCYSEERHSHVDGEVAWSIGRLYCNSYDEDGNITKRGTDKSTEYTYMFTKDEGGSWKLQMVMYHE